MKKLNLLIFLTLTVSFCIYSKAEVLSDKQFLHEHSLEAPVKAFLDYNETATGSDYYILRGLRSSDGKAVFLLGEIHVHNQEAFDAGSEFIRHFKHRVIEGVPNDEVRQFGFTEELDELTEKNYYLSEQLPSLLISAVNQAGAISVGYQGLYFIGLGQKTNGDRNFKCFTSEQWIHMLYAGLTNKYYWSEEMLGDCNEYQEDYRFSVDKKFKLSALNNFKYINHWLEGDYCIRCGGYHEYYLVQKRNNRAVHNLKKIMKNFPDQQVILVIQGKDHINGVYLSLRNGGLFRDMNLDNPEDRVIVKTNFGYQYADEIEKNSFNW